MIAYLDLWLPLGLIALGAGLYSGAALALFARLGGWL